MFFGLLHRFGLDITPKNWKNSGLSQKTFWSFQSTQVLFFAAKNLFVKVVNKNYEGGSSKFFIANRTSFPKPIKETLAIKNCMKLPYYQHLI